MSRRRSRRVRSQKSTQSARGQQPRQDRLPGWWRRISRRLDWAGHIAERLEPSFQNRWVPLVLLLFPFLLLTLALLIASLR